MVGSRPARSRVGNSAEEAVRKKINAVRNMKAAGYDPEAFIIREEPLSHIDMAKVTRQFFAAPKPIVPVRSTVEILRRLPPTPVVRRSQRPQGAWASTKAVLRGVEDSLPFDAADYGHAALAAIGAGWASGDPVLAFDRRLAAERAQNRYDEVAHPVARTVGKVLGTGAQFAVPGLGWTRALKAKRMAEAAPLIFKEIDRLTAFGGAMGLGAQAVDDVVNRRVSPWADYGGAMLGGGAGALTAMYGGPQYVGGVTGATTSVAQDLLNGRLGSSDDLRSTIERTADAAAVGNLFSRPIGGAVTHGLGSLTPRQKGKVGEWLAKQRTRLRGREVKASQVSTPVSGGRTRVDHFEVNGDAVEAKFGNRPTLSKRQREAYRELPNYRVDNFMLKDIGAAAGVPLGMAPYWLFDDDRQ